MKSYLFETEGDRGGVILCDVETLEDAVVYLQNRFKGVVKVQQGRDYWSQEDGLNLTPETQAALDAEAAKAAES